MSKKVTIIAILCFISFSCSRKRLYITVEPKKITRVYSNDDTKKVDIVKISMQYHGLEPGYSRSITVLVPPQKWRPISISDTPCSKLECFNDKVEDVYIIKSKKAFYVSVFINKINIKNYYYRTKIEVLYTDYHLDIRKVETIEIKVMQKR